MSARLPAAGGHTACLAPAHDPKMRSYGRRRCRYGHGRRARSRPRAPALEKGLKTGALGFVSSVVIGVASTAPGYSLAASLGVVAASVALQSPAIMWVAFIPMFFIAASYYAMNRVDPDCGTTFSWVTRGLGPVGGLDRGLGAV